MVKLIKKGTTEVQEISGGEEAAAEPELTQIVEARRAPIIDRGTFEARASAQSIRDRAQAQADEIVVQAQAEAQRLIEQAQADAEALRTEAMAAGLAQGRQNGAAQLLEVVARHTVQAQEYESNLLPQLSGLAIKIARKILGRELEFHPEAVVQIVKQALGDKARQRREISLRVHPDDAQMIRDHKPQLVEMLSRSKDIAIREDPNVQRHGVIIETDAGTIDAQLDTQLAVFERVLKEV